MTSAPSAGSGVLSALALLVSLLVLMQGASVSGKLRGLSLRQGALHLPREYPPIPHAPHQSTTKSAVQLQYKLSSPLPPIQQSNTNSAVHYYQLNSPMQTHWTTTTNSAVQYQLNSPMPIQWTTTTNSTAKYQLSSPLPPTQQSNTNYLHKHRTNILSLTFSANLWQVHHTCHICLHDGCHVGAQKIS